MSQAIRVPYVNLAAQHKPLKAELMAAVERVLDGGQFILGPAVEAFEAKFADLCGTRFAVGVGNGTDALILALRALNVGSGDEVITAPNSFVATTSAIVLTGAKPVFVDVGDDYNMDPALIERAITPRTRAILPVHLTGRSARMDEIGAIARSRGLAVIEDAAQAVIAEYRGRRVGSLGAAGCFSLHPLKTLNACGDGGVITTHDADLAQRLRVLRNIGLRTRDECVAWSGNSRLDTLQAALLLVKLNYLQQWTDARRNNASFYRRALSNIRGISLPDQRSDENPVYHTFVIQADRRDALKAYLLKQGIESSIHYPIPIHLHPAAAELRLPAGSFPVAERQAQRILSLPIHPDLSQQQLQMVADAIAAFYKRD